MKFDDELAKLLPGGVYPDFGGVNPDFGGVYADGLLRVTCDELVGASDDFAVNAFDPKVYPDGLFRGEVGESTLADLVVLPLSIPLAWAADMLVAGAA